MGDNLESYVVIDARAKQVFSPTPPFKMLGAMALDLPADLWRDFVFFAEEARKQEVHGSGELRYRFLRASLLCLFSHLNAMFDLLISACKSDVDYQRFRRQEVPARSTLPNWPRCEHGRFLVIFTDFVKSEKDIHLPDIDWSIKPLRNLLAHPAGVRDVTVADLYDFQVPPEGTVCRRHCLIVNCRSDVWVYDLGSPGTFLNNTPVKPKAPIGGSATLRIGRNEYRVADNSNTLV